MGKRKIGILVFSKKIRDRYTRKNNYYDSLEYAGLKKIIRDIDKTKNQLEFCSAYNINNYDFVLVSLISYYDVVNFINELHSKFIKTKIIVGGAAVINIELYKHLVYAIVFGRGENLINDIFEGRENDSVYYSNNEKSTYKIRQVNELIHEDKYEEKSVGCIKKCFFCQYGWKYSTPKTCSYKSGMDDTEDFFKDFNWETAKSRAITALDGTNEITRLIVNKKLSKFEITSKIKDAYNIETNKPLCVKIFNIVGYPWENKTLEFNELWDAVKSADKKDKTHKIWLKLSLNHFKPMPLTPMERESVNLYNFRNKFSMQNRIYMGNNIELTILPYIYTPVISIEETIINRADQSYLDNFIKIILSNKYKNLRSKKKIEILVKYFSSLLNYQEKLITDKLITPYNRIKTIKAYENRKNKYLKTKLV